MLGDLSFRGAPGRGDRGRAAAARGADAFVMAVGGAVASFAGVDSPFTKVVGLGFADPPSDG